MNSGAGGSGPADGSGSGDAPDDEDTVQRPVDGAPPRPASDFIDRAPFERHIVPDHAPIQRFDQRPRLGPPSPAAPPSGGTAPPPPAAAPTLPPGIDATVPRRRGLLLPALAFGCAMALLLGIGGGLTALWLVGRDGEPAPVADSDPGTTAPGTEPGSWEPLDAGQVPSGGPEELQQVLADNPLLEAQLQVPDRCALPPTEGGMLTSAELTAHLEAGAACLESTWSTALEQVGLTVEGPEVVVFTAESPPSDSACEAARFTDHAPVLCHDDGILYWPADWDPGFSNTSAEEAPGLYMWHLSYSYTVFMLAAADLDGYYGALLVALADDPERAEEAQRRHALQISCLSSAAAFRLPQGVRPEGRVESFVTSPEAQAAPTTGGDPAPESRVSWIGAGQDSGGALGECGTWAAEADAVA